MCLIFNCLWAFFFFFFEFCLSKNAAHNCFFLLAQLDQKREAQRVNMNLVFTSKKKSQMTLTPFNSLLPWQLALADPRCRDSVSVCECEKLQMGNVLTAKFRWGKSKLHRRNFENFYHY